MPVSLLLFDVGGVLLTNAWEVGSRRCAAEKFGLEWEEFERRHQLALTDFETGRLSLDAYLDRTVFDKERHFGRDEFRSFMFAQSQPDPASLAILADLAGSGQYLIAALNNESRELNEYRIQRFELRRYFDAFFSSCYLGARKPDERIYRLALDIAQRAPDECLFVDDREINVDAALRLGMQAIRFRDAGQLRARLREDGVAAGGGLA